MKQIYLLLLAVLLVIAVPVAHAVASDSATDNEVVAFLTDPEALTKWLGHHDASNNLDALVRVITAVDRSQLNASEKMQVVAVSVAHVIRTSDPAAQVTLVAVARHVDSRWLPVMVAAAAVVRNSQGLAVQQALIASCEDNVALSAKAHAAATSPGQILGIAIAIRTATPPGDGRVPPMPGRAARAAPVQVLAAELKSTGR